MNKITSSFVQIVANVWALGEEGDFTHQISKYLVASKLALNFYLKAPARLFCQTLVMRGI
jgi:hypothetical protein